MKRLISRLDQWMEEHRPAYYAKLQPGLSGDQLHEFERDIGFRVPDAFKELYAWKNGQDPGCSAAMQHNRMFMRIEDVLDTHRMLNEFLEGGEFDHEMWWSPQMGPVPGEWWRRSPMHRHGRGVRRGRGAGHQFLA